MTTPIIAPSGVQHRFLPAAFEADSDGKITAALSSELPVRTRFGDEVLVHTREAVNLDRASRGLPLLLDHDHTRQLGRVVNVRLEAGRLKGDLIFSERAEVAGTVADIRAGLRPDLSVGYQIDEIENGPEPGAYRATRWTPLEISSVLVPADHSVGIGRSHHERIYHMHTPTTPAPSAPSPDDARAERARVLDIQEAGRRLSLDPALVTRAINEGWSIGQLAAQHSSSRPAVAIRTPENPVAGDNFENGKRSFSLVKAVAAMAGDKQLTGLEAEVSQEMRVRNGGVAPRGVLVPLEVLSQRTQLAGTAGIGGNLVATDFRPQDFVEPLRNASVVMTLGARLLTDLVGNVAIPRQTSASAAQWVAEDVAAEKSTINFDQVSMNFKTVTANVAWSRQMLLQGLPAMETIMRADLAAQLGIAIDLAAINGAGSGTIPRGILNTSGIGAVVGGTNGAALDYSHLVDLESQVALANADAGNLGYLVNAKTRGHCKKTVKFGSGTEMPIWDGGSEPLNGYRAGVSNQVPGNLTKGTADGTASAVIFGNFADLLIGMWGGLDLLLDPYTNSTSGRVVLTAHQSVDIAVRHPQSFAAMVDALTPSS